MHSDELGGPRFSFSPFQLRFPQAIPCRPRCHLKREADEVVKLDVESFCHATEVPPPRFPVYLGCFDLPDDCGREITALRYLLAGEILFAA